MSKKTECAACDNEAGTTYGIHRDGFGEGPEVMLCDDCGSGFLPTCEKFMDSARHTPSCLVYRTTNVKGGDR